MKRTKNNIINNNNNESGFPNFIKRPITNIINKENYETRFPNLNSNFIDILDKDSIEVYLELYSAYSYFFRKYITDKLDLKKYDYKLTNSNLNYLKVEDENMDIYQDFSKNVLNYFYIRNNLYVERLTSDEKKYVYAKFVTNDDVMSDTMTHFIETTYKKVIFEDISSDGHLYDINYGPDNPMYYAPNDALIIGVRYDDFNLNGQTGEEWDANRKKQFDYLFELMENIENDGKNKLSALVTCIKYDEYSVKIVKK